MAADVEERVDISTAVPDNNEWYSGHAESQVVPCLGESVLVRDEDPMLGDNGSLLEIVHGLLPEP